MTVDDTSDVVTFIGMSRIVSTRVILAYRLAEGTLSSGSKISVRTRGWTCTRNARNGGSVLLRDGESLRDLPHEAYISRYFSCR